MTNPFTSNHFGSRPATVRPALVLEPPEPEVGDTAVVTVLSRDAAELRDDAGNLWPVRHGTRLELRLHDPLQLTLHDRAGALLAQATVVPHVDVPAIKAWNLPTAIDYAVDGVVFQPATRCAVSMRLHWRLAGSPDWTPIAGSPPVLPTRPCGLRATRLEVRATLRSRHAGLHPDATVEHIKTIDIADPAPQWAVIMTPTLHRFDVASIALRARWAREARLQAFGRTVVCPEPAEPGAETATVALPVPTAEIGEHAVEVEIVGHDGQVKRERQHLIVGPREPRCEFLPAVGGGIAYRISGARPLGLEMPALAQRLALYSMHGVIEHDSPLAVAATLTYEDDVGQPHSACVTVPPRLGGWPSLPPMPQLSGA